MVTYNSHGQLFIHPLAPPWQANLLGLPAISVPVGHDAAGLPIGLQFIGRAWTEATLLRLASVVEAAKRDEISRERFAPELWVNPLTGESSTATTRQ